MTSLLVADGEAPEFDFGTFRQHLISSDFRRLHAQRAFSCFVEIYATIGGLAGLFMRLFPPRCSGVDISPT